MSYTPEQGDVIWVDFDPSSGKEIAKQRPALVVSRKVFNETTSLCIVCPISNGGRQNSLGVPVPGSCESTGVVQVWQVRTIDWTAPSRGVKFIEALPDDAIDAVKQYLNLIIQ